MRNHFYHKTSAPLKSGYFYLFFIFISFFIAFVSVYIIVVIFTRRFIRSIFFYIVVFHIVSHFFSVIDTFIFHVVCLHIFSPVISVIDKFIFHIIIFRSDILLIGWIFFIWLIRCWLFRRCTTRSKKHTRKQYSYYFSPHIFSLLFPCFTVSLTSFWRHMLFCTAFPSFFHKKST